MPFWWKFGILIASYLAVGMVGWRAHTWRDGYIESKAQTEIIGTRIVQEKSSNDDAARTENKIAEDRISAEEQNQKLEKSIETQKISFDCVVPPVGMLGLQQAVTSHTRAR